METVQHKWYGSINGAFKIPIGESTRHIKQVDSHLFAESERVYIDSGSIYMHNYPSLVAYSADLGYRLIGKNELPYRRYVTHADHLRERYILWIDPLSRMPVWKDEYMGNESLEEREELITQSIMEREDYLVLNALTDSWARSSNLYVFSKCGDEWLVDPSLEGNARIMGEWDLYTRLLK